MEGSCNEAVIVSMDMFRVERNAPSHPKVERHGWNIKWIGKAAEADWFIGRIIYRDELHS